MIDRTEANRALAKALAYAQVGKTRDAELWAAQLVLILGAAGILKPQYAVRTEAGPLLQAMEA